MPYRGSFTPLAPCFRHPSAESQGICSRCSHSMCEICTVFVGTSPYCPACSAAARRWQKAARLTLGMGVLAFIGFATAMVGYVAFRSPVDYGVHKQKVRALTAAIDQAPCDREIIVELAETLLAANDPKGALYQARTFFKQCGLHPRLRWVTYAAHN